MSVSVKTTTTSTNTSDAAKAFNVYKKQFLSQNFWKQETAFFVLKQLRLTKVYPYTILPLFSITGAYALDTYCPYDMPRTRAS